MSCLKLPVFEMTAPPVDVDAPLSEVQLQGEVEGAILRADSHCSLVTPEELRVPLHPPMTDAHCGPLHW